MEGKDLTIMRQSFGLLRVQNSSINFIYDLFRATFICPSLAIPENVSTTDACGILDYAYELVREESDGASTSVASGEGEVTDTVTITAEGLTDGDYTLRVRLTDGCQNEGYCSYAFSVQTGKKPSAVCVSSITAQLNGMDLDNDGTVDTALAVVWAEEFDASSQAACGGVDSLLEFRIELIDGIGDDTWEDDTTYLEVGCPAGAQRVRLWVIDPSGTTDFCDVLLEVQDDNNYCTTTVGTQQGELIQVVVNSQQAEVDRTPIGGQKVNMSGDVEGGVGSGVEDGFVLYQNRPNPFGEETSIGFYFPESTSATLTMYDVSGKIVHSVKGTYGKGYHEVVLRSIDLDIVGVLYYQLDTPKYTATRKMIVVH